MTGVFLWILFCQRLENSTFLGVKLEEYLPCMVGVLRTLCFKVGIERSDSIRGAHPPLTVRFNTDEFLYLFYRPSPSEYDKIGINQLKCGVDVPRVPPVKRVVIETFDETLQTPPMTDNDTPKVVNLLENQIDALKARLAQASDRETALQSEKSKLLDMLSAEQEKTRVLMLPNPCLLYTSPSPRDRTRSRMPSSA